MVPALLQLVPLAIAAALSSVPISATILILLSPKRDRSALPFLIGWIAGMALIVVVARIGAGAIPSPEFQPQGRGFFVAEVVLGAGLLTYGVIAAVRGIRKRRLSSSARWLEAVSSFGPRSSFGLAFALNFRPKGLLVAVAAGLAVAGAALVLVNTVIVITIYLAVAVSTVAVPIIAALVAPEWTEPKLRAARVWLERNGLVVSAAVVGVIGVVLTLAGLSKLL